MEENETTEVAVIEHGSLVERDPTVAFANNEKIVRYMSEKCTGPQFISNIQGRMYPKVEWWTTVGMSLGLFPIITEVERIDIEGGGYKYEAWCEVRRNGQTLTRGKGMCSTEERAWGARDEYAVSSMAQTRATGKAYRIGLSALAVMAGLEPTPADEIPPQGFSNSAPTDYGTCPEHGVAYFQSGKMRSPAHKYLVNGETKFCNKPADAPVSPPGRTPPDWMTEDYHAAADAFKVLFTDPDQRLQYVIDTIGRKIEHPSDVTAEEWKKVRQSAEGDLASMGDGAPGEDVEDLTF